MSGPRGAQQTPTLFQVIAEAIEAKLRSVFTMLPGTVVSVDKTTGLISAQPDFSSLFADAPDTPVPLPEIPGIPVYEVRAGAARISVPVKKGDKVTLIFSSRALDDWKRSGARAVPPSGRTHALSDAVAFPGLYAQNEALPLTDDLLIEFGAAKIKLVQDELIEMKVTNGTLAVNKQGKFKITNGTTDVLVQLSEALGRNITAIDEFLLATFPTALGPSGTIVNPLPFQQLKQQTTKAKKLVDQLIM